MVPEPVLPVGTVLLGLPTALFLDGQRHQNRGQPFTGYSVVVRLCPFHSWLQGQESGPRIPSPLALYTALPGPVHTLPS